MGISKWNSYRNIVRSRATWWMKWQKVLCHRTHHCGVVQQTFAWTSHSKRVSFTMSMQAETLTGFLFSLPAYKDVFTIFPAGRYSIVCSNSSHNDVAYALINRTEYKVRFSAKLSIDSLLQIFPRMFAHVLYRKRPMEWKHLRDREKNDRIFHSPIQLELHN